MKVIGLTGFAGSGKDYISDRIAKMFPRRHHRIALADEVRLEVATEVLSAVSVTLIEDLDTDTLGQWARPYTDAQRRLLQLWGTEVRRAEDPEYWVKKTKQRIYNKPADSIVCVTDVRFPNEVQMVRDLGGIVAEVYASEDTIRQRVGRVQAHDSEALLHGTLGHYKPDTFVNNDGGEYPYTEGVLIDYLDLPVSCVPCLKLQRHPWHSDGTEAMIAQDEYEGPQGPR